MTTKKNYISGIVCILLAAFFYAVMPVMVRLLGAEIPPFAQVFLRYIVAASVAFGFVIRKKESLKPKNNNYKHI